MAIIITYLYNYKIESQGSMFMSSARRASFLLHRLKTGRKKIALLRTRQFKEGHMTFPKLILSRNSNPITGLDRPWGFQKVEASRFQDNRHMNVVRLSVLFTGRPYPPGNIPGTHFCWRVNQPQGHSAAGRIMSVKNSNGIIGNRTRDHPACSAVPQTAAPIRAPLSRKLLRKPLSLHNSKFV